MFGQTRTRSEPGLPSDPSVMLVFPSARFEPPAAASGRPDARIRAGVDDVAMSQEREVGPAANVPPGTVVGAGDYAVGNINGELFALSRRCRHLGADLANGCIDEEGHLVCPWHQSAYDVHTGRMVRGPQGVFAKIPGLGAAYCALTRVLPLRRGQVVERNGHLFVR
jgi:nitrite reductase/ring-hydroxylating ferredoxin subunit